MSVLVTREMLSKSDTFQFQKDNQEAEVTLTPLLYGLANELVTKVFDRPYYEIEIIDSGMQFSIVRIFKHENADEDTREKFLKIKGDNKKDLEDEYKEVMTAYIEDNVLSMEVLDVDVQKFDLNSLDPNDIVEFCQKYKNSKYYKEDECETPPHMVAEVANAQ